MFKTNRLEWKSLLDLTARVGNNPLLTNASTGNISAKLDDTMWIKASGKWMASALHDDIFIPLNLKDVQECLRRGLDPAERFPGASLETAMHAALPHPVVLHVHSVNTIAWAVRRDARARLATRLDGLRWQLVPYVASGLPLYREVRHALTADPGADVFIMANHGLVIGGNDVAQIEDLLIDVEQRLNIRPRPVPCPRYSALAKICERSPWDLPHDDGVHALSTDAISRTILAGGLLYPCQAIFSDDETEDLFQPVEYLDCRHARCTHRKFMIVEELGVVINKTARPAEVAMLSGLARVTQRLGASVPVRYLTQAELAELSGQVVYRYRELANMNQMSGHA